MNQDIDYSELPLRDIHLPDAIGWWPPAPGWWLLVAAVFAGIAMLGLRHYRYRRHRAALRALARIETALEEGAEPVDCLQNLSAVLRRFVMTIASPADALTVPGLVGSRWLEYLDGQFAADGFRSGVGRLLTDAPYAPPSSVAPEQARELTQLCAQWVREQPVRRRSD